MARGRKVELIFVKSCRPSPSLSQPIVRLESTRGNFDIPQISRISCTTYNCLYECPINRSVDICGKMISFVCLVPDSIRFFHRSQFAYLLFQSEKQTTKSIQCHVLSCRPYLRVSDNKSQNLNLG